MSSVTQRIKEVKQPYGGYIPLSTFTITHIDDKQILHPRENVAAGLVGSAVECLTKVMLGCSPESAFSIAFNGAMMIREGHIASKMLERITGLDDLSIKLALQIVGYEVCFRAGRHAYIPIYYISPDDNTIENVRIMVKRGIEAFNEYGPIVSYGFTFKGGYTETISSGDGDILTKDILWDIKTSIRKPDKNQTLQILIYYIMGINSVHSEFYDIKNIAILNTRLGEMYSLPVKQIDENIIEKIKTNVIGY